MNTTTVEEKFTDQFFASTQGRNDIRREMIEEYLQAHTDRVVEAMEKKKRPRIDTEVALKNGITLKHNDINAKFNQGIDTSIQIVKITT